MAKCRKASLNRGNNQSIPRWCDNINLEIKKIMPSSGKRCWKIHSYEDNLRFIPTDGRSDLYKWSPLDVTNPQIAIKNGIGMVHQHFMLVPSFTVAENVVLGSEPRKNSIIMDFDQAVKITKELSEKYGLYVDPYQRVEDLSVGIQQRIEILKILYKGRYFNFDEPTAVLTPGNPGVICHYAAAGGELAKLLY